MFLSKINFYKRAIPIVFLLILFLIVLQESYLRKYKGIYLSRLNTIIEEKYKRIANTPIDNSNEINDCHKQWIQLNNHVFFRPYFALYFLDLKQLKLYYSKHKQHNYSFVLDLVLKIDDDIYVNKTIAQYSILSHSGHDNYKIESVVAYFNLVEFLPEEYINKTRDLKNHVQMEMRISTVDGKHTLKTPLKIKIKNFRENDALKRKAMVCSKQFYFEPSYAKTFIWWIELNRMHGYDKLVFFNHSIPNTPELNDAFKRHADFVEIKQLQCYPNFIDENNSHKLFVNEHDFRHVYKIDPLFHHLHLEFLCYNECFFENIDRYVHIAVFDQDESIIPRRIKKLAMLDINTTVSKYDFNNAQCSKSAHITSYFNDLKKRLHSTGNYKHLDFQNGTLSFHFLMALFIKNSKIKDLFSELDAYFKKNAKFKEYTLQISDPDDRNQQGKLGVRYNVTIRSHDEYVYARFLNDLYKQEVKPFLERNREALKDLPEVFSRLYFVNGDTTSWMCGKTVHHTQMSHWVSNHYPEGNNFLNLVWTPQKYGHLSHFRTSLKDLNGRNISISDFNFDLNYFLCYFKPIVNNLNYKLIF